MTVRTGTGGKDSRQWSTTGPASQWLSVKASAISTTKKGREPVILNLGLHRRELREASTLFEVNVKG